MTNTLASLTPYFQDLADQDQFSGVALVTQGNQQLFAGAFGFTRQAHYRDRGDWDMMYYNGWALSLV